MTFAAIETPRRGPAPGLFALIFGLLILGIGAPVTPAAAKSWCEGGYCYEKTCQPVTKSKYVPKRQCKTVKRRDCRKVPQNKCRVVTRTSCKPVRQKACKVGIKCETKIKRKCKRVKRGHNEGGKVCRNKKKRVCKPKLSCDWVTKKQCRKIKDRVCNKQYVTKCTTKRDRVCDTVNVKVTDTDQSCRTRKWRRSCPAGTKWSASGCQQVAGTPDVSPDVSPIVGQCLPRDLYDLVVDTYGPRDGLRPCAASALCLPAPAGLSPAKLDELADVHGINWCQSCLQVTTFLNPDVIDAIELRAGIQLCPVPEVMCVPRKRTIHKTQTIIRKSFKTLPVQFEEPSAIAVLIGNHDYDTGLPIKASGERDVSAMRTLFTDRMGLGEDKIIDLRNATLDDLEDVFGDGAGNPGRLAGMVGDGKQTDVFVYYSGHGLTAAGGRESYLVPVDANAARLSATSYAVSRLYSNLSGTGARSVMVFLEAHFGDRIVQDVQPPNLPAGESFVAPGEQNPGLMVLTASDRDQRTLENPDLGIGLFTQHLVDGLGGRADQQPIGDGGGAIDSVELYAYVASQVRRMARRSFGVEQKPVLYQAGNMTVGRLAGRF